MKTLDEKLQRIAKDPACRDFILIDAKDADMAFGLAATGAEADGRLRSQPEYRRQMVENLEQGLVDGVLMSPSTADLLARHEKRFVGTRVTPAVRTNDSTDIWLASEGRYRETPSRPFRSASLEQLMYGGVKAAEDAAADVDLGLYSITFNNDAESDLRSLEAYKRFREEASEKGFRHFLEVFDPNRLSEPITDVARYVADCVVRTLAGAVGSARPLFLKVAYHGPAAMEQLADYDPSMIVGILGGSSGTSYDAFFQLWEARKYGARAAIYGRMINNSEHQPTFIQHLRWLADGDATDPREMVRSYHAAIGELGFRPIRDLESDLEATNRA